MNGNVFVVHHNLINKCVFSFKVLLDIGVFVLCGQLLEPLWGALEFLVSNNFFSMVNLLYLHYSQFMSHVTSISENEMNIRIFLRNV